MKRKEWVILAVVIGAVAALEVFGTGGGSGRDTGPDDSVREAPRVADPTDQAADPMEAYRTVGLHVTGMT